MTVNLIRIAQLLRQAARHPVPAHWGVREFRSDYTRHYHDWDEGISYDCGRELAHIVTFRRWDW